MGLTFLTRILLVSITVGEEESECLFIKKSFNADNYSRLIIRFLCQIFPCAFEAFVEPVSADYDSG
jgi:hypothetical protein